MNELFLEINQDSAAAVMAGQYQAAILKTNISIQIIKYSNSQGKVTYKWRILTTSIELYTILEKKLIKNER